MSVSTTRTFEFVEGGSRKFWNITRLSNGFQVHYGRLGTAGQRQEKIFADEAKAQEEYDKIVAEKLKKGYTETTPVAERPPTTLREALEVAIDENPSDLAAWMALADHLAEEGDPRGELMQVQLALEDGKRTPAERAELTEREAELLKKYRKDLWGELKSWDKNRVSVTWARGHIDTVKFEMMSWEHAQAMRKAPALRFLRVLAAEYFDSFHPEHEDELPEGLNPNRSHSAIGLLVDAPFLGHLRELCLGEPVDFEEDTYSSNGLFAFGVIDLLRRTPNLESFQLFGKGLDLQRFFGLPLPHLRELVLYHERESHPFGVLSKNEHMSNLQVLRIHPAHQWEDSVIPQAEVIAFVHSPFFPRLRELHLQASDLGDEGCQAIVESGILQRLKVLDLRHGCIQDAGARALLKCPDLAKLQRVDLSYNEISSPIVEEMISALGSEKIWIVGQSEPGSNEYLYSGDIE
jgi:uncharacterized protein (TIGR02996 family)